MVRDSRKSRQKSAKHAAYFEKNHKKQQNTASIQHGYDSNKLFWFWFKTQYIFVATHAWYVNSFLQNEWFGWLTMKIIIISTKSSQFN